MLLKGDCLETLKSLPDNSVDSIVTDPPYGLEFMGKDWDAPWRNAEVVSVTDKKTNGVFHDKGFTSGVRYNKGHKEMLAFQEWFTEIAKECLRVLKPGGHFLAFGGTRTYHRLACAIEDAGFEIRDSIHWTYGSGFPKSHNIGKAIDKKAGAPVKVGKRFTVAGGIEAQPTPQGEAREEMRHNAITPEAQQWQGWGTALKPSHEPIVVARKPFEGTVANNVLTYGTGAINIDGSRVGMTQSDTKKSSGNWKPQGYKVGENIYELGTNVIATEQSALGRWPANTIITHAAGCIQKEGTSEIVGGGAKASSGFVNGYENDGFVGKEITNAVWNCVEGCPTLGFPEGRSAGKYERGHVNSSGPAAINIDRAGHETTQYSDSGSAARFFTQTAYDDEADFPPFIYMAKASKADRNAGLDDLETKQTVGGGGMTNVGDKYGSIKAPAKNFHPTVKPVALMQHLVRLVTPAGGKVLDPFLGSGTTAVAAILEGCEWVGCEITPDYWQIIEARVLWAEKKVGENVTLF